MIVISRKPAEDRSSTEKGVSADEDTEETDDGQEVECDGSDQESARDWGNILVDRKPSGTHRCLWGGNKIHANL